jgi:hypothetical protein
MNARKIHQTGSMFLLMFTAMSEHKGEPIPAGSYVYSNTGSNQGPIRLRPESHKLFIIDISINI